MNYQKTQKKFEKEKQTEKRKPPEDEILKKVLAKKEEYEKSYAGRKFLDVYKIQKDFNLGITIARRIKNKVEMEIYNLRI